MQTPTKLFLPILALCASGCVLGPYDRQEVGSTTEQRWFTGYTLDASATVRVLVLNQATQGWVTVATVVSASSPSIIANVWYDNPSLYYWSVPATLANLCFYNPTCTPPSGDYGVSTVRIRFEQGSGSNLIVFDENWSPCMSEQMAGGASFTTAAYNCRSWSYPELRLRLVGEWWQTTTLAVTSPPAIGGGLTGEITLATSNGTTINLSRNTTQSTPTQNMIGPWISLSGASGAGMATDAAPVIASTPDESVLRLFVRSNDARIYASNRNASWTNLFLLPQISSVVPGRISAALGSSTITHIAHAGASGTVSYWRLQGATVDGATAHLDTFTGIEATVGSRGADQALLVVRGASSLSVWSFSDWQSWAPQLIGTLNIGPIDDLSEVVYYGAKYHFLYARNVGGQGGIVHVSTNGNTPGDLISRTVAPYSIGATPANVAIAVSHSRGRGAFSQVTVVHGHLLAAWRDALPGIQSARWDRAQASAPWLQEPTIGATTSFIGRPALGGANLYPIGNSGNVPSFGNDVFVAARSSDQRIRFANFTRGMMRRDVARHFDLFGFGQGTGCSNDNNTPDAVWLEELMQNDRPILSELGALYWALPQWFTDEVFRESAKAQCRNGLRQPAPAYAGRACELEKMAIVVKPLAQIYICGDGAYLNHDSSVTAVWEEVGHFTAGMLGFLDSSAQPTSWNAEVTDIPLPALLSGRALFASSLGGCGDLPRCPGFTQIYDTSSLQHSFIYAVYAYMFFGSQMRAWIDQDLQLPSCNDLLARKYLWIRSSLFPGVEFDDRGEPVPAPSTIPTCN